jgi:hypothetical protein
MQIQVCEGTYESWETNAVHMEGNAVPGRQMRSIRTTKRILGGKCGP